MLAWLLILLFVNLTGQTQAEIKTVQGPFPVKGEIFDGTGQFKGVAHVFPRYVEIFDDRDNLVGKVGILVEKGMAKLFLVSSDEKQSLVGYASGGKIFGKSDELVGTYFWTPTWSFVYDLKGKRAGKVKCIAWPRVCAVGVAGYLLNLFGINNEPTP